MARGSKGADKAFPHPLGVSFLEAHFHGAEDRVEAVISKRAAYYALILRDIGAETVVGETIVVDLLVFARAQHGGIFEVTTDCYVLGNRDLCSSFHDS